MATMDYQEFIGRCVSMYLHVNIWDCMRGEMGKLGVGWGHGSPSLSGTWDYDVPISFYFLCIVISSFSLQSPWLDFQ